jgi:hypothetical protein
MSEREENVTPVPGAATGSDVTPAAVRDAAGVIWLFWSDANGGDSQGDLFFKRLGTSM